MQIRINKKSYIDPSLNADKAAIRRILMSMKFRESIVKYKPSKAKM